MEGCHPQVEPKHVVASDPWVRYIMAESEKFSVHIPTFLQQNAGDPAVKVNGLPPSRASLIHPLLQNFNPKLKQYLLPRVVVQHLMEAESAETLDIRVASSGALEENFVFLKNDNIYEHKRVHFHFTTYDVRRGTDIVNPGTSRCNVMFLADDAMSPSCPHRFLYARVLGIYHANVIYTAIQDLWHGTTNRAALTFCGCDGLKSSIHCLLDGVAPDWTWFTFLRCTKAALSTLWIQEKYCGDVISFLHLLKAGDKQMMGLVYHVAQRMGKIITFIMLAGVFELDGIFDSNSFKYPASLTGIFSCAITGEKASDIAMHSHPWPLPRVIVLFTRRQKRRKTINIQILN